MNLTLVLVGVGEFIFSFNFFYIDEETYIMEYHTNPIYKPLVFQAIEPIQRVAQNGRRGNQTLTGVL